MDDKTTERPRLIVKPKDGSKVLSTGQKSKGQPSDVQHRWLERGLKEPGGKLPLFDLNGQRVSERTVRSCVEKGWAEPWFANPTKPDWMVCRLTDRGRQVLELKK